MASEGAFPHGWQRTSGIWPRVSLRWTVLRRPRELLLSHLPILAPIDWLSAILWRSHKIPACGVSYPRSARLSPRLFFDGLEVLACGASYSRAPYGALDGTDVRSAS